MIFEAINNRENIHSIFRFCLGLLALMVSNLSLSITAHGDRRSQPNVVIIMLDDVGFGAASTFGGFAETPQLSKLANDGLIYNRFHVVGTCAPTRASLLTGRNHHRVGYGMVNDAGSGSHAGYNGLWPKEAASIAAVLKSKGFSTAAFGKWHNTPVKEISPVGPFDRWPTGLGFEYFYGIMLGASEWEPNLYRNTLAVDPPAAEKSSYHLTQGLADDAIAWVQTHTSLAPEKPFFVYFAPLATITPIHAPDAWIEKYRGKFDQGWDRLREEIFIRQKKLGIIPEGTDLPPRPDGLPAWDSFSAAEKRLLARQMEVYAGFLSHTDFEIGRFLDAVKNSPGGENTLVLYIVGDNGASAEGELYGRDNWGAPEADLSHRLERMNELGGPKHLNHYAYGWAFAMSTPFQWMKQIASHFGATRSPLVVAWPRGIRDKGSIRSQFVHVVDIAPTVYEACKIKPPSSVDGTQQMTLDGISFFPTFTKADAPSERKVQYFEMLGSRAIYKDGWVASARHGIPWTTANQYEHFDDEKWELYNIDTDFSQAHDLAMQNPEKLEELRELFNEEARRNKVFPLGGFYDEAYLNWYKTWHVESECQGCKFTYHSTLPRIPSFAAPNFSQPHRITAKIRVPAGGAEGVLISNGSRFGGFVMYVDNNHLFYENNFAGVSRTIIKSNKILPDSGDVEVAFVYKPAGEESSGGSGQLYINGVPDALVNIPAVTTGPPILSGSFNIGQDRVSPVSDSYSIPYRFTGEIERIVVEIE